MSKKPPQECNLPIQQCKAPKCRGAATRTVSYYGAYPTNVCTHHVGWAWKRVQEIEAS